MLIETIYGSLPVVDQTCDHANSFLALRHIAQSSEFYLLWNNALTLLY
jgi:hypothetical protein